jgi:hypothetical protein
MKNVKVFWTVGCWISLFLVSVYHDLFHNHEPALPVWYAAFIVLTVGLVTLSSPRKTSTF